MTQPGADVVVLTALGLEYQAVREHLTGTVGHTGANGTRYEVGTLCGGRCRVALALLGEGNLAAAALTGRAIEEFQPRILMLVGVAGGLTDEVVLGDVVVATRIHAYHGGRSETAGFRPRPKGWPLSHGLEQVAREVALTGSWTRRLPGAEPAPRVHFKPIVSGDVLLDSRKSPVAALIADYYSDAIAIDMESAGVAEAAHRNDFHQVITVRGVSDTAEGGKHHTDKLGWQPRAAAQAAAFAAAIADRIYGRPPAEPIGASPFRGLAAFQEADAALYFGRAELADELAAMATRFRFVAVAGRSGSGKSSLVNAGLVPRMRGRGWTVASFRPLPDVPPAFALAAGLLPLLRPGLDRTEALAHRAALAEGITAGRLPEVLGEVLAASGTDRILVCVDQFEEFVARSEPAARDLAGLLARLATGGTRAHVVLTVRTETLDIAVNRLGLGELSRNSVFLVTPMRPDELRSAIESPVAPTSVAFEPGLVERILEAAEDAPAALALTQFALTRLWDEQRHGMLTHAAYDGFGGVGGALASYAERVWSQDLVDTERLQAHRLLVQLVRPNGDDVVVGDGGWVGLVMRRIARESELEPDLIPLARRLATTRLLVTGVDTAGETTYDLAHAALARHWQRLRDWLSEERDFRAWQEDLREGIRRAEPVRGPRLATALRWLRAHPNGITGAERAFITTSRRRNRWRSTAWRSGLVVIVVLLAVASTFAVNLQRRTGELESQLRQNAAHALVAQAREHLSTEPDTAALLMLAAHRSTSDPAVLANLSGEYLRFRSTNRLFDAGAGEISEVELSADGRVAATLGVGGAAVWRTDRPSSTPEYQVRGVGHIALSSDGRLLATADDQGRVEVRQPDGAAIVLEAGQPGNPASSLRFDGSGRRLLAMFPRDGPRIWDIERQAQIPIPAAAVAAAKSFYAAAWLGPDAGSLVVATYHELTLWRLETGRPTKLTSLTDPSVATVTGDGRSAITCASGTLVYWDLSTAREQKRWPAAKDSCPALSGGRFDHSGRILLSSAARESDDHPRDIVSLVDVETGATAQAVLPNTMPPNLSQARLASTGDGARLVIPVGRSIAVVDVPAAGFTALNGLVDAPMVSEDLRFAVAATASPKPLVRLWDVASGRELAQASVPNPLQPLRFSADSTRLLAKVNDAQRLVVLEVPTLRVIASPELPADSAAPPGRFCVSRMSTPDTVAILSGSQVTRFNLRTGAQVGSPIRPDQEDLSRLGGIASCAARPGRDEIAYDVGTGVQVWDLNRGTHITLPVKDIGTIAAMRFSADGRLLAVLGFYGSAQIWDVDRRQPVGDAQKLVQPNMATGIVDFPSANRIIVHTTSIVRVWDLDARAAIANIDGTLYSYPFVTPDGGTLVFWGKGALTRIALDPGRWVAHLCQVVGRDLTDAERRALPPGSPTTGVC